MIFQTKSQCAERAQREEGDQSVVSALISFQNTQKGIRHSLSAVIK
jgi:hypothetical protein